LMVRPPGRERFSGTSRKPHCAPLSAAMGSGGFGQGPGTNRDGAAALGPADWAGGDAALLGVGPIAARQTRAAAAVIAWMLCCGM
jgi:hypothetical protein